MRPLPACRTRDPGSLSRPAPACAGYPHHAVSRQAPSMRTGSDAGPTTAARAIHLLHRQGRHRVGARKHWPCAARYLSVFQLCAGGIRHEFNGSFCHHPCCQPYLEGIRERHASSATASLQHASQNNRRSMAPWLGGEALPTIGHACNLSVELLSASLNIVFTLAVLLFAVGWQIASAMAASLEGQAGRRNIDHARNPISRIQQCAIHGSGTTP